MDPNRITPDPFMRAGLVFAGANFAWKGKDTSKSKDNGIITAYVISTMNFDNTDLVVLSACKTALGDVSVVNMVSKKKAFT